MSAPIRELLPDEDWEIRAAGLLDEVRPLGKKLIDPYAADDRDLDACEAPSVGLWMLMQELAVRPEGSPVDIWWRRPVTHFSKLRSDPSVGCALVGGSDGTSLLQEAGCPLSE